MTEERFNRILSPPLFVEGWNSDLLYSSTLPRHLQGFPAEAVFATHLREIIFGEDTSYVDNSEMWSSIAAQAVSAASEYHLRELIANCALRVIVPDLHSKLPFLRPRKFKSYLSPSVAKRLLFADKSGAVYDAVAEYYAPFDCAAGNSRPWNHTLDSLIWLTYCLILAAKTGSECPVDVQEFDRLLQGVKSQTLSLEGQARLANIQALRNSFDSASISALQPVVSPNSNALRERADEILNDAYLLEASFLRRFLSFASNRQAVKRDLSKLLKFISRNRSWAKDIITTTSHIVSLPRSSVQVMEGLLSVCASMPSAATPPLLRPPQMQRYRGQGLWMWELYRVRAGIAGVQRKS